MPARRAAGVIGSPSLDRLAKVAVTGLAGIVDRLVGAGDHRLVAALRRGGQPLGSGLHALHERVDAWLGGEDLRLNPAFPDIRTGGEKICQRGGPKDDSLCRWYGGKGGVGLS